MNYVDYVNVKQGTANHFTFSNGNILPITGMPFGMSSFSLETNGIGTEGWYYSPSSMLTTGIRLTHQPSPWVGDYGEIAFMTTSGDRVYFDYNRRSGYRPSETVMNPYYMNVRFMQYRSTLDLVPTLRGAVGHGTWDNTGRTQRFLICNVSGMEASIKIEPEKRRVVGYTRARVVPAPDSYAEYFVFEFDREFDLEKTVIKDYDGDKTAAVTGDGASVSIAFKDDGRHDVNYKLMTSFIGYDQLELNFKAELSDSDREQYKAAAKYEWEKYLSKLEIETDNDELMRTFYSSLYRMLLFPRVFYEINADGKPVHFNSITGGISEGTMYTDNGFWDTYKTVYPLYSLILSDKYAEFIDGFLNYYDESGWLPKWLSIGELGYMPGTMIDAVFADAVVKGVVTDKAKIEKMLSGMIKHANTKSEEHIHGREGIEEYLERGYVTSGVKESVNKTLDYAYGDFCIARVAEHLGKDDIAKEYYKRSKNYKNLLDKANGLMRAKNAEGKMRDDWTSFDWGWDYCEGSSWQNSFAVYHDLLGMADAMGGRDAMTEKLDELFSTPPYYIPYGYDTEIHEMTEMAAVDFGQCALSNQPSFHIPYIYSCMGIKDKTAYWVRRALRELFGSDEFGYPGDEDNGSAGGWVVFSAMGFYPVCPGVDQYVIGSPAVKKCTIHADSGVDYVIEAPDNSDENIYISAMRENSVEIHRTYLNHSDIKKGGRLVFDMSSIAPHEDYSADSLPYSVIKEKGLL